MMLPPAIRVYLACGFTDMRRGFDGLAAQVQTVLSLDPYGGALFVFRGRRARHTTFHIQFASRDDCLSMASVVGADVQVSPHRRGKELTRIYTTERPDFSRELPNRMFDQAYCAV